MSKTLVVITAALAVLVTYLAVQPDRRERAQIMFREVSAWIQKQFWAVAVNLPRSSRPRTRSRPPPPGSMPTEDAASRARSAPVRCSTRRARPLCRRRGSRSSCHRPRRSSSRRTIFSALMKPPSAVRSRRMASSFWVHRLYACEVREVPLAKASRNHDHPQLAERATGRLPGEALGPVAPRRRWLLASPWAMEAARLGWTDPRPVRR